MADRKTHELVDKLVLGRKFSHVHRIKDLPAKYLGPHHRKLFHDPLTNILIGAMYGPEAMLSGFLHDMVDIASSKLKSKSRKRRGRKCRRKR